MPDPSVLAHVRPADWVNPEPAEQYDLVAVGGGTAGLVSAAGAAGLGARVALVEQVQLGGDCLMTGCVPSKALLRAARVVEQTREGAALGITANPEVDFKAVIAQLIASQVALAPHDSAERFRGLGVDVFFGRAAFLDRRTVSVGGRRLRFRRAVIATGTRPAVPDIPGLHAVPFLTSDSIFELSSCPAHLVIVGGGPAGCELAQAFSLLGARVTLLEAAPHILPHEDPDASAVLTTALMNAGVRVLVGTRVSGVSPSGQQVRVSLAGERAGESDVVGDRLLIAAGRQPNVDGLGLDRAGVTATARGIVVDRTLRTANRRIFAAGDVSSTNRFTHAADAAARIVVQNALFFGRARADELLIPRCVYTSPEVAHVGAEARALPEGAGTVTVALKDVDRAVIDRECQGFVRIHHQRGRLIGATIVAPNAGELVGLLGLLIQQRTTFGQLSSTIFPYPTVAEALRKAGDAYRRRALTPSVQSWLGRYFSLLRRF